MEILDNGDVYFLKKLMTFDEFLSLIKDSNRFSVRDDGMGKITIWHGLERDELKYYNLDPNLEGFLNVILNICREQKREETKNNLFRSAVDRGVIPEEYEKKQLLRERLEEEVSTTNDLCNQCRKKKIVSLSTIVLSTIGLTSGILLTGDNSLLCALTTAATVTTSFMGLINYIGYKTGKIAVEDTLKSYEDLLKEVKGETNPMIDELIENKYEDKLKIKKYNDKFIEEVARIAVLLDKLPDIKSAPYRKHVEGIVNEYQMKINEIIDREDTLVLAKATDSYSLLVEMLPELYRVERELIAILEKEQKKNRVNEDIEDVKNLLQRKNKSLSKAA